MTAEVPMVYVDCDDVLAETTRGILDLHHARTGRRVAFEAVEHFDLGLSLGLDRGALAAFFDAIHQEAILGSVAPMRDASDTLCEWAEEGAEIHVMTGRPPETADTTERWLERHGFPPSLVGHVDKYGRHEPRPGAPIPLSLAELAERRYAIAVEDSIETAAFLAEAVEVSVVLFDRPWNRDVSALSEVARRRIVRCASWAEIRERVPFPRPGLW